MFFFSDSACENSRNPVPGVAILQKRVRGMIARRRVTKMLRQLHPHNLILTLKNAENVNIADSHDSDPYVVVSGHQTIHAHTETEGMHVVMNQQSYTRSSVISNTINPIWNERIIVTNAKWNSDVVLTLFDYNITRSDVFLGQVIINVRDHQALYSGATISCRIRIGDLKTNVKDQKGQSLISDPSVVMSGQGHLLFDMRLPSLAYSMCGWMYKLSTGLTHSSKWVRRWVILVDFRLSYYESPMNLSKERGSIMCDDVYRINYEGDYMEVFFGDGEGDFWAFRTAEDEPLQIQRMWLRKILRCCPTTSSQDERSGAVARVHRKGTVRSSHRAPPLKTACCVLPGESDAGVNEATKLGEA